LTEENILHRQALEPWLGEDGTIIQYWQSDSSFLTSYYVVAFPRKGDKDRYSGTHIYCYRVFGGLTNEKDGVDVPVNVSVDQIASIFPDSGSLLSLQNRPNWSPAEGYER